MKMTIDLERIEKKILNIIEIDDEVVKGTMIESLEELSSEKQVNRFEDALAFGIVQELMKEFSGEVRLRND